MTSAPLLEVRDLEFGYGSVQVLFGVDLVVSEHGVLALLGTNGSGKSTLLRVVAGLAAPWRGRVLLDGDDVSTADARAMIDRGVVLVEGGRATFADLTVAENLEIGTYRLRRQPREAAARRAAVLEQFPLLREKFRHTAGTLSGGEQQLLAVAKGLTAAPRLLLVDEVSLGLSPTVIEQLLAVLRTVHLDGTTLVLVEQSLDVAASMAERSVFLEKGQVRFEGRTDELIERDDVARAVFLGTEAIGR